MSTQNTAATTARVQIRPQTIREAYDPPANVLEVDVVNAETHGLGAKRYTDYEVRLRVNIQKHSTTHLDLII
jgi:sorting nexin-3/12